MRRIIPLGALFLSAVPALAQNDLETLLAEGVFGVPWTATVEQVAAVYPNGEITRTGDAVIYTVRDGRTIFEVARRNRDALEFGFWTNRGLASVSIEFKDCVAVYPKALKFFGEPDVPMNTDPNRIPEIMPLGVWKDGPFTLRIVAAPGMPGADCTISIEKDVGTDDATAEDLGLN